MAFVATFAPLPIALVYFPFHVFFVILNLFWGTWQWLLVKLWNPFIIILSSFFVSFYKFSWDEVWWVTTSLGAYELVWNHMCFSMKKIFWLYQCSLWFYKSGDWGLERWPNGPGSQLEPSCVLSGSLGVTKTILWRVMASGFHRLWYILWFCWVAICIDETQACSKAPAPNVFFTQHMHHFCFFLSCFYLLS